MSAITYGQTTDIGRATKAYPEVIRAAKVMLLQRLRDEAERAGLDILTETNLTWPEPVHFQFADVAGVWGPVECSESESRFTRLAVEATYEEIK